MNKRLAVVLAGALTFSAGAAGLAQAKPGPNGYNNHGLCTAYFNGSETGQANKRKAPPFLELEEAADDGDANTTPAEDVARFCEGMIGGRAGRG